MGRKRKSALSLVVRAWTNALALPVGRPGQATLRTEKDSASRKRRAQTGHLRQGAHTQDLRISADAKGSKHPGRTPQPEGGTRIPREGAQSRVEINGCRQHREQQLVSLDPNPRWLAGSQAATYRGFVHGAGAGQPQRACRRTLWRSTVGKERTPESLSKGDETGRLSLS